MITLRIKKINRLYITDRRESKVVKTKKTQLYVMSWIIIISIFLFTLGFNIIFIKFKIKIGKNKQAVDIEQDREEW